MVWLPSSFQVLFPPIPSRNAGFVFLCFMLALFACFLVITINYVAWLGLTWLGFFRLWRILDSRNDFYTQLRCVCVVTYQDGG